VRRSKPETGNRLRVVRYLCNLNTLSDFTSSVGQVHSNFLLGRWKFMVEYHLLVRILLIWSAVLSCGVREGKGWE